MKKMHVAYSILFTALISTTSVIADPQATPLTTIRVADGLNRPLFVTSPPGDLNRLFIVEQDGIIKILKDGSILPIPFLDIDIQVGSSGNEQGLLGLAFHPDYDVNGYFYINYTNTSGDTRISRYSVSANPDIADIASEFNLLTISQPVINHNGGMLSFGPHDGYLYIANGDGGGSGDPANRSQTDGNLYGKVLRIDVDGGVPYGIPPDNPFLTNATIPDEVWAKGLRNPWRFSFDQLTGDMYIADVGQGEWEEINFESAESSGGLNYGWRCYEGYHEHNTIGCDDSATYDFPITEYSHSFGCSITGGYVYRGCAIPDLQGTYFYGDYCSGKVWSFKYDGAVITDSTERTSELDPGAGLDIGGIASFGEDGQGEIYICDLFDGEIFKIIPDGVSSACAFLCGDANNDQDVNLLDILFLIENIYDSGPEPEIFNSADVDNSGDLNLLDILALIAFIYDNGPALNCP